MKSKILKFLTLAAALCGATAWGTTRNVANQEQFAAAIAASGDGDVIALQAGEYAMNGAKFASGISVTLEGAGASTTTLKYGNSATYDSGNEAGSEYGFEGVAATFSGLTLTDVNGAAPGFDGFVRANGLTFNNCTLTSMLTYLGCDKTTVTF